MKDYLVFNQRAKKSHSNGSYLKWEFTIPAMYSKQWENFLIVFVSCISSKKIENMMIPFILNSLLWFKHNPNLRKLLLQLTMTCLANGINTKAQASYHQIHLLLTLVHHLSRYLGHSPASQSLKEKRKERKIARYFILTLMITLALLMSKVSNNISYLYCI